MSSVRGPSTGYIDLLNEATTAFLKNEQVHPTSKTPLRPSNAGKCTRELYYDLMRHHKKASYPSPLKTPEVHRLLSLGNSIEYNLIKQMEAHLDMVAVRYKQQTLSFFKLEAEKDTSLSQWLEGSIDLCLWSDKWKCCIDVKSKKDKFSTYRGTKWDEELGKLAGMASVQTLSPSSFWVADLGAFLAELSDPFFEANFLQLNLYMNSDFLKERGVDHAAIIRYNKNDSRLMEIRFAPSADVYEATKHKFATVLKAVDTDSGAPARDYRLGSMKCAFCDFSATCWDSNALKAWFRTMPPKDWPKRVTELGAVGDALSVALADYTTLTTTVVARTALEDAILDLMVSQELPRIEDSTGQVWEAKHLKSPYPHFELRKGKK